MNNPNLSYDSLQSAVSYIRSQTSIKPLMGLVLGSGLGAIAEVISDAQIISYADIPSFPKSNAPSHKGQLCIGHLGNVPVVLMQGRVHMYEGYSPEEVTFPIRVMQELGIETLLVTNAAGGINKGYQVGDLMVIEDHLNLPGMTGLDPTRGAYSAELGPRFTPLNNSYDPSLISQATSIAKKHNIKMHKGVYAFLVGPCFETPAEIRFLNMAGADAVGMSTVPEVMIARNAGIKVLAISAITNMSIHEINTINETTEEEVWDNVKEIIPKLSTIVTELVEGISNDK